MLLLWLNAKRKGHMVPESASAAMSASVKRLDRLIDNMCEACSFSFMPYALDTHAAIANMHPYT